jgi:hypothetical protein
MTEFYYFTQKAEASPIMWSIGIKPSPISLSIFLDELKQIPQFCRGDDESISMNHFYNSITISTNVIYVFAGKGEESSIKGVIAFNYDNVGKEAHIVSLCTVEPGYGAPLVELVKKYTSKTGGLVLSTIASKNNMGFYQKMGFVEDANGFINNQIRMNYRVDGRKGGYRRKSKTRGSCKSKIRRTKKSKKHYR